MPSLFFRRSFSSCIGSRFSRPFVVVATAAAAGVAASSSYNSPWLVAACQQSNQAARVSFEELEKICYALMDSDYVECGHVARSEVDLTVQKHAFCQMGTLSPQGLRTLIDDHLGGAQLTAGSAVFVDIGCGYGNLCLQVFGEWPGVRISRGVDLLPSRIEAAETAATLSRLFFPSMYEDEKRELEFLCGDMTDASVARKAYSDASVIFCHSWMFEPETLSALGEQIVKQDSGALRVLISSREIPQFSDRPGWKKDFLSLEADWNDTAPFFIYKKEA